MRHQPLLRGLVVVGGDDQLRRHAEVLDDIRRVDDLARAVAARAGNDAGAVFRALGDEANDLNVLIPRHRRWFARRARGNQRAHAARNLAFYEVVQRIPVDFAVLERRNQRRTSACEQRFHCDNFLPDIYTIFALHPVRNVPLAAEQLRRQDAAARRAGEKRDDITVAVLALSRR